MKKIRKIVCVFLVATLLLSVGCSKKTVAEQPINVALPDDIVSLDAAGTRDVISEALARCIFSTLYTFDADLNLVPCLAESEEQVSDKEWQFNLRKDVSFHDGSPLTAEDVKASLDRAMSIERVDKSLLVIDTVETVDDFTLRVTTKESCANLPSVFVRSSTSVMQKKALESTDYDFNKPIGSGPFKLLERTEGESILLERYDSYFLGEAKSKNLNFFVLPSEQERTAGLLNGKIDVVFRVSTYDGYELKLNESVKIYENDSTKLEMMMFNPDYEPLNDIRVRQAIAYAIDRQNLVDNAFDGYGSVVNSVLPDTIMGSINNGDFNYDPEKARTLLEEAGYSEGIDITVLTFDMLRKKMMDYIKLDLANVGINLNYEFLQQEDYLDVIKQNQHRCTIMSWTSNADPDSTFSQMYSKNGGITINQSKYSDEQVEELMLLGKQERDPKKRSEMYEKANQLVCDSYYFLPLYQAKILVATTKDIEGVCINPQGLFGYENLFRVK